MQYAAVTNRLAGLGGSKWQIHNLAQSLQAQGQEIIQLTIGEPDVTTPPELIETATSAMAAGRTGYTNGRGEAALLDALAERYSQRIGREITPSQIMCFPGTQTSLFAVFMGLVQAGDEVLVGDPMYATYEGVIAATGAKMVSVPLRAENGFRMSASDLASRITPQTRAIFLNTPHNPTGAILTRKDLAEIGDLARRHDLWIVSDEVYEEMVFDGQEFNSALVNAEFADRTIIVASISKSHAAPGFRSGWAIGPAEFTDRLLPLSETMLFGNQPFIADMTAVAVSTPSPVAPEMVARFSRRAALVATQLNDKNGLQVNSPQAGMFCLVDISRTGMNSRDFAIALLHECGVAVMPGTSFGAALQKWIRISLTVDDAILSQACQRIRDFAALAKTRGAA